MGDVVWNRNLVRLSKFCMYLSTEHVDNHKPLDPRVESVEERGPGMSYNRNQPKLDYITGIQRSLPQSYQTGQK